MNDDVWAQIEAAAEAGEADRVVDLCVPLADATRRNLSTRAAKLARRLRITTSDFRRDGSRGFIDPVRGAQAAASGAVLYCVGPPSAITPRVSVPYQRKEEVVRARSRAWRDGWAEQIVEQRRDWHLLRALIREGECTKPTSLAYVRMMVDCVDIPRKPGERFRRDPYGGLLADPELLENDVWRIFEIEEKILSLGWYSWDTALIRLADEGVISRDRLLDETLGALRRDFPPAVAATFSKFYDLLKPTPTEEAARIDQSLDLLGSPVDSTVSFAVRHLTALERSGTVDTRELLDHVGPAMVVRPKGTAKRAVALLAKALKREPALASAGIDLAIDALSHDAVEVQAEALGVIETHAEGLDQSHLERLGGALPMIDPSTRARLVKLLGTESEMVADDAGDDSGSVDMPPLAQLDPMDVPRLNPDKAITPVGDLDELLELASAVLEAPNDPDEIERLLDGISRLCHQPVPERRANAVLRQVDRAFRASNDWGSTLARHMIGALVHQWLRHTSPPINIAAPRGPRAAISRRLATLGGRAEHGQSDVLLSAPTHTGGFIDPAVLLERIAAARKIDDDDLAQALMRLAPDGRHLPPSGGSSSSASHIEALAVVHAALGDQSSGPKKRTKLPASWDSVALLRHRDAVDLEPRPEKEPYSWQKDAPPIPVSPPVSPARLLGQYENYQQAATDANLQKWLALVAPLDHRIYYAAVVRSLSFTTLMFHARASDQPAAALEPLLDPDEPLGSAAYELLAIALGGGDSLRLIATDVVIDAISTRRLEPRTLGAAIATAMPQKYAVPDRFGDALSSVPQVSALHAHETQQILEACLATLGPEQLRMTKVLDLLRKIAVEADARVSDQAARARLEEISPRSKSGQTARAILAVNGHGTARSRDAAAIASAADADRRARLLPPRAKAS